RALGVGGAPAAGVEHRDAAQLSGRAVAARPVAVARRAAAVDADRRRTVGGIDAAGGVAAAGVAGARRPVADLPAGAVGRHAALARDADVVDAEVLRSVRGDARGVAAARLTHAGPRVADLPAPALRGGEAHPGDAAAV